MQLLTNFLPPSFGKEQILPEEMDIHTKMHTQILGLVSFGPDHDLFAEIVIYLF